MVLAVPVQVVRQLNDRLDAIVHRARPVELLQTIIELFAAPLDDIIGYHPELTEYNMALIFHPSLW